MESPTRTTRMTSTIQDKETLLERVLTPRLHWIAATIPVLEPEPEPQDLATIQEVLVLILVPILVPVLILVDSVLELALELALELLPLPLKMPAIKTTLALLLRAPTSTTSVSSTP